MDEWVEDGKAVGMDHPLSFKRADMELCFDRIRPDLRMPEENLHFPTEDVQEYIATWDTGAMRGDAGRSRRREALGIQRSLEA